MGLIKSIRQQDGVTTNYHRILSVSVAPNSHNSIVVVSYVDNEAREADTAPDVRPYRRAVTYETDYNPHMTIRAAYDWLKANVPAFEGAEDDGETQTDEVTGDEFITMLEEVL
jgi:hypothetical protein